MLVCLTCTASTHSNHMFAHRKFLLKDVWCWPVRCSIRRRLLLRCVCDCPRTAYFTKQLYAAMALIDRGTLSAATRGSMHGEVGHTQFLPKNILNYGTGGSRLSSGSCNFRRAHRRERYHPVPIPPRRLSPKRARKSALGVFLFASAWSGSSLLRGTVVVGHLAISWLVPYQQGCTL